MGQQGLEGLQGFNDALWLQCFLMTKSRSPECWPEWCMVHMCPELVLPLPTIFYLSLF